MVSAIIPAFNEAERVARAIRTLRTSSYINEIIVVNDGSTDNTTAVAKSAGAQVITLPQNNGKAQAMHAGVRMAQNNTILFCDGDMYGFDAAGIATIVLPVLHKESDLMIGIRPFTSYAKCFLPFLARISGFRCLTRDHWFAIPSTFMSGYQIELGMNFVAKENGWRVRAVTVPGLSHTVKESKHGLFAGLQSRTRMCFDVACLFFRIYCTKRKDAQEEFMLTFDTNVVHSDEEHATTMSELR